MNHKYKFGYSKKFADAWAEMKKRQKEQEKKGAGLAMLSTILKTLPKKSGEEVIMW